jgi:Tol biopolymer transport system component/predicted Ser/Thr protein kinase
MTDTARDRFGPFIVVGAIGAGGMGEVFRARDPRLNRDVAIKVLTGAGSDAARQRRFTDEAQAASALNHPNILTVYDVGDQDGTPFIVSELIEGVSLRTLLARAPLTVREVLDLAVQMADGLAAAHRAGIVHRDFKPENAMVTGEGRVKILDFGLATMAERSASSDVTLTNVATIQGTVPYMSPEQARGAAVDHRTDQFSLGVTLYEMLTGRRAFQAPSAPQILAAILEDDPEPIAKLNPRVAAPVRWIVERCLAKDPRQRYESTADLARDLATLRDRLAEVASVGEVAPVVPRRSRPLQTAWALGATAAAIALGFAIGRVGGRDEPSLEDYRFTPFATEAGYQAAPAWSPDGKTLAYVAVVDGVQQVFTRAIGSPLRAQVTHARFDCQQPFWSADGTRLNYISLARTRDGLWSVSVAGGEPDLVMENVARATIAPDGRTLAVLRTDDESGLHTLWLWSPGNDPTIYSTGDFQNHKFLDATIQFAPDARKIGLWGIENPQGNRASVTFWLVPLDGTRPHAAPAVADPSLMFAAPFSWLPDSRHIVSTLPRPRPGAHLWILDTEGGAPRLVTAGESFETDPAASPDGSRLASAFQQGNYDLYRLSLSRQPVEPVLASSRNEMDPVWSPAVSQLAFTTDRSGTDEIWLRSATGDFERPLVTQAAFGVRDTYLLNSPTFSPDGQRVAYYHEGGQNGGNRIFVSPVAGGPPVELTKSRGAEEDLPTWSPDGNWIAFSMNSGGYYGKWSLAKARIGTEPQVVVQSIAPGSPSSWSPDGAWIAFNALTGLSIVSADGTSTRSIDDEPWMGFTWSEDGRQLFGIHLSDNFKHLTFSSIDIESRRRRVHAADFMPLPAAARPVRGFTRVSGDTFFTSVVHVSSDIWLLDGFRAPLSSWQRLARLWR